MILVNLLHFEFEYSKRNKYKKMKRFLLATDFSKASENAFVYAAELIKGKDIKLDVLSVYDLPPAYSSQTPPRAVSGYIEELKISSTRRLKELHERLPSENQGDIHPIYGTYPSSEIEETALATNTDMIIMALRKDYGILRKMIGSTTSRTIEKSSIPVMAIPAKASPTVIRNILFPTAIANKKSLSSEDMKAIQWLTLFSGFLDMPNIELVHILDDEKTDTADVTIDHNHFDNLKLTYSHAMTVGEGIQGYMIKKRPDLIAFYKKHRTFWERLYKPSNTRQLLYNSSVPILVFG